MITPEDRMALHLSDEAFEGWLATGQIPESTPTLRSGGYALYRYYDYQDKLLYVGISSCLAGQERT